MRAKAVGIRAACGFVVLGAAWAFGAGTARVDLSKPFDQDKETIALYHLDDLPAGAKAAEGRFGKALDCDGAKGWVDIESVPQKEGLTALTTECWVKFRGRAWADLICRNSQVMLRVQGTAQAYFWIDGNWRVVKGAKAVPADRWTHLAITWDQATKTASVYVDGQLDVAQEPDGITDAKLGGGAGGLRLGGHTWAENPMFLNGLLDEVRISSVARQYQTAAPAAPPQEEPLVTEKPLKPWAANTEPTDVAKTKVVEITEGTQKYTVVQGGTMDGRSCRSPAWD